MANSGSRLGFSVGGVGDTTWGETTITYANAPSIGSTVNSSGAVTSGNRASVDVASLVAPAQGGLVSFGLNGSATQINLSSRESATPPTLTIVVGSGPGGVPTASFTSSATTQLSRVPIPFTDTSSGN